MTYANYVSQLTTALQIDDPTEANWVIFLPKIIEDAESICYRDLDPLVMRQATSGTIAVGATSISLPADWLVGREIFVSTGLVRNRIRRADDTFLSAYAMPADVGKPRYWAQPTFGTLTLAPPSDAVYTYTASYTGKPVALSATNTTTWLTSYVPDLFFSASMVLGAGYQKNFGAMSEDPRSGLSWDQLYARELASAIRAEGRRKGEGYFDQTSSPPPSSTAPR